MTTLGSLFMMYNLSKLATLANNKHSPKILNCDQYQKNEPNKVER